MAIFENQTTTEVEAVAAQNAALAIVEQSALDGSDFRRFTLDGTASNDALAIGQVLHINVALLRGPGAVAGDSSISDVAFEHLVENGGAIAAVRIPGYPSDAARVLIMHAFDHATEILERGHRTPAQKLRAKFAESFHWLPFVQA